MSGFSHPTPSATLPTVEICSSCWNYHRLLCYSLSAYVLYPPKTAAVTVTICHAPPADDPLTSQILHWFAANHNPPNITWRWLEFSTPELMRRAISRNFVARRTTADWMWFTDLDYLFRRDTIDTILAAMQRECGNAGAPRMVAPTYLLSSKSHEAGDFEISRCNNPPQIVDIDESLYERIRLPRPIGGTHWIPGDVARRHGYMRRSRFQRPAESWQRTWEDAYFRVFCQRKGVKPVQVEIPNVWRIRHGQRGREHTGCKL